MPLLERGWIRLCQRLELMPFLAHGLNTHVFALSLLQATGRELERLTEALVDLSKRVERVIGLPAGVGQCTLLRLVTGRHRKRCLSVSGERVEQLFERPLEFVPVPFQPAEADVGVDRAHDQEDRDAQWQCERNTDEQETSRHQIVREEFFPRSGK